MIGLGRDLMLEFSIIEMLNMLNKPTIILPLLLRQTEAVNRYLFNDIGSDKEEETPKDLFIMVPLPHTFYNQNIKNPFWEDDK
jgi:hypothetical protein